MNATFTLNSRPTCPTILIPYEKQLYALPLEKLDIRTEFNVATAFVRIVAVWKNVAKYTTDCMFVLPLNGTVTSVHIEMKEKALDTLIIGKEEAKQIQEEARARAAAEKEKKKEEKKPDDEKSAALPQGGVSMDEYIPNLFRLPIEGVSPQETIIVTCVYMEPLDFIDGKYRFSMPLKFGQKLLAKGKTFDEVVSFKAIVNNVAEDTKVESVSHSLRTRQLRNRREVVVETFALQCPPRYEGDPPSTGSLDLIILYSVSATTILPTLLYEETASTDPAEEPEGTFMLFVTPPGLDAVKGKYKRSVVFLLDRSGSMAGEPYAEATRALSAALGKLSSDDKFTIVCFDHRMERFTKQDLVPATESHIEKASTWIRVYHPERGGTDIQTPLQWALKILEATNDGSMPFIVLLTDGCVMNEREICKYAHEHCQRTRILTLGIGSYCNWFFLKMLAQIGRGFSDVVVYREKIYSQILQLINMAAVPILTNITLDIDGLSEVEVYPFPFPDLFAGAPLALSGRYRGRFPKTVTLSGVMVDDEQFNMTIVSRPTDVVPVAKVFLKQRLDLLTARAWLEQSKEVEKNVVELSVRASMPTAFTTMVAVESKNPGGGKDEADEDERLLGELDMQEEAAQSKGKGGGAQGDDKEKDGARKAKLEAARQKWYRDKRTVAALAVGGVVIVGAAAFSFGNLAATASNDSVLAVLGAGGGACCECCGGADCGCADVCAAGCTC